MTDRYSPEVGGTERMVSTLAHGLALRSHQVVVIAPALDSASAGTTTEDGVVVVRYPICRTNTLRIYYEARAGAIRSAQPYLGWCDVVHLHGPMTGRAFIGPGKHRTIYTYYGPWHLEYLSEVSTRRYEGWKMFAAPLWKRLFGRWLYRSQKAVLRGTPHLVVLSEYSRHELSCFESGLGARAQCIPGVVATSYLAPANRSDVRRRLNVPRDALLVVSARRLVPRMGLDLLIDAIALLPAVGRQLLLVIAGTGPERDALERRVAARGLEACVRFVGLVTDEDLKGWLQAADVVAVPSRELESFGLTTLEAYACGTPVAVTPVGGLPAVVRRVDPGLIASRVDAVAIREVLERSLERSSPELAVRRRRVAEEFSIERYVDATLALYSRVMSGETSQDVAAR